MSDFFRFLSRKGGAAEPRRPSLDNGNLEDKPLAAAAIPQKAEGTADEPLSAGEGAAADSALLVLKLADFIARIPPHLRKESDFDSQRPLSFDMGWIMGRIDRGLSTVPLSKLLEAAPDLFTEGAAANQNLEIQFPWRRVMELLKESELAARENGGESLAQKFRRQCKPSKRPASDLIENSPPVEVRPAEPPPVKSRVGRNGENVWYSRNKSTIGDVIKSEPPRPEGKATLPPALGTEGNWDESGKMPLLRCATLAPALGTAGNGSPAGGQASKVPDSAPALMELPEAEPGQGSTGAQPASGAPKGTSATATLKPSPDLMDLIIGPAPAATAVRNETKGSTGAPAVPDSAPALMELEELAEVKRDLLPSKGSNAGNHGAGQYGKSRNEMRIAQLEAQLSALSGQHQSELSVLRAERDRLAAQARADSTKVGREGAANFHAERKRLAAEKDEQLARIQTDLRAVIEVKQNEITELRAARREAMAERQTKDKDLAQLVEMRDVLAREKEALLEDSQKARLDLIGQQESAVAALRAEHQSALEAREISRGDDANALDEIKAESEREIASLRAAAEYRAVELEAKFKRERSLLIEEKDRALGTMEAEHRAALATRHAGYSEARAGHEKERTDLAGEREAAERRWTQERELLMQEKASQAADYEQRLTALIAEHERAAATFSSEAANRLTEAKSANDGEARAKLAAEHESALEGLRREADGKFSELKEQLENERKRVAADTDGSLASAATAHAGSLASKEAEIEGLKGEHERALAFSAKVREEAVSRVIAERDRLAREKEAAVAELAQRLANLTKQHEDALGALRSDAEGKAAEKEAALASKEAEIAQMKAEHERAHTEKVAAHESAAPQAALDREQLAREKEAVVAELEQRLANLTKQHEDTLGVLRSEAEGKAAEKEAALTSKEAEIEGLKGEHERALKEKAAAHEGAAAQAALERNQLAREKEAAVAELAQRLANLRKQHEETLGALRSDAEGKVTKKEAALTSKEAEIARMKEEHERALTEKAGAHESAAAQAALDREQLVREKEAAVAELEQRLTNLAKQHDETLGALRSDAERKAAEKEAALTSKEAEIARMKEEHERALKEKAAAHEGAAAQAALERNQLAREKEAAVAELEQRLANLTKQHEETLGALRSDAEGKVTEKEAALTSKEAEIAEMKEEHERVFTEKAAAHENSAAQAALDREQLAREKEAAVAELEQRLANLAKQHEDALAAIQTDAERKAAEKEAALTSKEAEMARMKEEHERALTDKARAHESAAAAAALDREQLVREKEAVLAEHAQKIARHSAEHAKLSSELESVRSERDRSAAMLLVEEQRAAELASKHEFDLLASRLEGAQIVADVRDDADQQIADLKAQHDRALAESADVRERALASAASERESVTRKMEAAIAEHERRFVATAKAHRETLAAKEAEMALRKSEYASALDASAIAHGKALEERHQLDQQKEAVIREREGRLATLTKKHETALAAFSALRDDFERQHSELEAAIAKRDARIAALGDELGSTRTALTAQRDQALSESAARAAELEMRNRGAEQFDTEVAQYRERIKTVLAERSALAKTSEEERRKHAHALSAAEQMIERLHSEHATAAAEQAEIHRKSLSAAREETKMAAAAARADLERDRQEVIAARSRILRDMTARAEAVISSPEKQ